VIGLDPITVATRSLGRGNDLAGIALRAQSTLEAKPSGAGLVAAQQALRGAKSLQRLEQARQVIGYTLQVPGF